MSRKSLPVESALLFVDSPAENAIMKKNTAGGYYMDITAKIFGAADYIRSRTDLRLAIGRILTVL